VRPVGTPAGAKLGGRLRLIRRELKAMCRFDAIPEAFDVDVTPMEVGDIVTSHQVPMPDGVRLLAEHDFNVLTVYGKRADLEEDEAEADGESDEAAAEPAAE
jgi:large subunit ribosomal protein L25